MTITLDEALKFVPGGLRIPLIQQFDELLVEYRAGDWEKVGLKAGKLCEIIYSIISGHLNGVFPSAPSKPGNMVAACQALENFNGTFPRSLRIQIPRLLIAVYELRNNRDIGHVGGDVDPNHMDAEFFLRSAKWFIAELVRVFGNFKVEEAQKLIEGLTEKIFPVVWEGGNSKRILNPDLSTKNKALILVYSTPQGVSAKSLAVWCDYNNLSRFRGDVLKELHDQALVHFDKTSDLVIILPPGIRLVEQSGLLVMS